MMTTTRQARFWVYLNSPTRIKINAGQRLNWHKWEKTDEGFSSEAHTWEFDGEVVTEEATFDGRDCDGRLTRYFGFTSIRRV